MTVLFAVLDGVTFGCCLAVLPTAMQDVLDSGVDLGAASTRGLLLLLMLCTALFGLGKSLTAFVNTLSLSKSSVGGVLLTFFCLFTFSFSYSMAWILSLRLVLGMLSGYLGYFYETDRASGLSRSGYVLAAGLSSCGAATFYVSPSHQSQPLVNASSFFWIHPLFVSYTVLAMGVLVFFALHVLSEKFGVLDDDDEALRSASSSYMPISGQLVSSDNSSCTHLSDDCVHDGGESGRPRLMSTSSSNSDNSTVGATGRLLNSSMNTSSSSKSRHGVFLSPTETVAEDVGTADLQVPGRFLRGCQGDHVEALRRWRLTLQWRRDYQVDGILNESQPHFFAIKQHYPHFLHGKSTKGNHPIYFEQLGKIDLGSMRELGIGVPHLLRHYIFMAEYIWTHVEPDFEHGKSITVLDVGGVSVGDLVGDPLDFFKESTKLIQNHYVERSQKIFVVNASFMFSWLWRMVQPMINESTRRKISILSSDMSELVAYVGAEVLPESYGGTSGDLGSSEEERQLAMFVHKLNSLESADEGVAINNNSATASAGVGAGIGTGIGTMNYGSVLASPPPPSGVEMISTAAPRSLSKAANSRRRKMKKYRKSDYVNDKRSLIGESGVNDIETRDEKELGYSDSDSGDYGDSSDEEDCNDHEEFHLSMMPSMMSAFYDKSVETIKNTIYGQAEPHAAFLGEKNQFSFKNGIWVEVKGDARSSRRKKRARRGKRRGGEGLSDSATNTSHSEDESDDTAIIRAIQASQGYYSESETESENMSLTKRLRRSFRRHITLKKEEALRRISWWSWLHWFWRAAIFVSLESLPVLLLLDRRHGGLGLPPIFLGLCLLFIAALIWTLQAKAESRPSQGFFKRALTIAFAMEILSVVTVAVICLSFDSRVQWTFDASPQKMCLLVAGLVAVFFSLLFSLSATTLFTAAVMTSCKSPLHAPFSRSKAYLADAAGGVLGLAVLLVADLGHWGLLSTAIVPLLITVFVHLLIAVFNVMNPNAAGKGVHLQSLLW